MNNKKFESHLTTHIKFADIVEKCCTPESGFKFSKIDGDALMGAKPYCYITAYDSDKFKLFDRMEFAKRHLSNEWGIETLRIKIEEIIYDTKTGVNNLS